MSSDKEQDYFSDGISEELLNLLAKVPELKVIARTSSFAFRDQKLEISEIARRLNVAHVLEGSVRKAGNTVRITAQLVRADDSTHLWSQTYDRPLDNIFAVQDEIAGAVVEQLKVTLLGAAPRSRVTDPKAFALFLRGRQLSEQFTPEAMRETIALLQQGLAIDPDYPEAWRKLAAVVLNEASFDLRPKQEAREEARGYIEKALQIDPEYGRGHDGLAVLAMNDLDLATAARHWQRALELDPTNTDILTNFSELLAAIRPLDAVMSVDKYVIERDPVGPLGYINLGWDYVYAGRLPEALEVFRTSLALSPGSLGRAGNIATVHLLMGDVQSALEAARQEPLARSRLTVEACAHFSAGDTAASDAAMQALEAAAGTGTEYSVATAAACRGEADRVFAALQASVAAKDKAMININNDPFFAGLRQDPRWLPFLRAHGLAPEQLAAIPVDVRLPGG
jgi:TolB-like protein/cytochrome c-type biogenesis protein CcmH/NrfG